MDFSTAERRRAMCEAEVEINRRLAPEIYFGVEPAGGDRGGVMRRLDEEGLTQPRAGRVWEGSRGAWARRATLTPERMAALGVRISGYHDGLAPIRDGFGRPD